MPDFHDKFRIEGVVAIRQTAAALLIDLGEDEIWIPQSQIDDDSEVWQQGDEGDLVVSAWFARQKGWL